MTTEAPARPLGVLALADGTYAVASSDPTHAPYHVVRCGALFTCTCPAWTYRKVDGSLCKHGWAVRAFLREQRPAAPRWCQVCLLSPVTDSFGVCRDCAARDAREQAADKAPADPASADDLAAFDLEAERARLRLVNAVADRQLGWEVGR